MRRHAQDRATRMLRLPRKDALRGLRSGLSDPLPPGPLEEEAKRIAQQFVDNTMQPRLTQEVIPSGVEDYPQC